MSALKFISDRRDHQRGQRTHAIDFAALARLRHYALRRRVNARDHCTTISFQVSENAGDYRKLCFREFYCYRVLRQRRSTGKGPFDLFLIYSSWTR